MDIDHLTPMLSQYRQIKARFPDAIVLFRLGDFFETFEDDARIAARELELVLTSRSFAKGVRLPMAGVPHHHVQSYIAKLIDLGYKVALVEQLEDPKKTKKLVKRDVVRVITPGTVVEDALLRAKSENYLAAIVSQPSPPAPLPSGQPSRRYADTGRERGRLGLHRSRRVVLRLSALFSLDAFAGGLIIQSLLAYWFHLRFGVDESVLGIIFFGANILAGISALSAARIAAKVGLINTMVFTHVPSSILLMLVPLMPNLPLAIAFLLARFSISQMDVPTRQSYTLAVVAPDERSAASGVTTIARSVGAALALSDGIAIAEFADKAETILWNGIHLLLIDLLPPGPHDPQGMHAAIWERFDDEPYVLPPHEPAGAKESP